MIARIVEIRSAAIDRSRVDVNSDLREIEALHGLDRLEFTRPISFFVGENVSGKSMLLEAIAAGFNPSGGTRNDRFPNRDIHGQLCDAIQRRMCTGRGGPGMGRRIHPMEGAVFDGYISALDMAFARSLCYNVHRMRAMRPIVDQQRRIMR